MAGRKRPPTDWIMVSEVAKILGVSEQRVRQLDGALRPIRTTNQMRLYDREHVSQVAAARAARAALLSAQKGTDE